jgi:ankyrin repeat protein
MWTSIKSATVKYALLPFVILACSREDSARRELAALNVEYSKDSMFTAVQKGDRKAAALFLDSGMESKATINRNGETMSLLGAAVVSKDPQMVELVAQHGANINEFDAFTGRVNEFQVEDTALGVAATLDSAELVTTLIKLGANIELGRRLKDKNNKLLKVTPLRLAVSNRRINNVKAIVAGSADINANDSGFTALSSAYMSGDIETINFLLKSGALATEKSEQAKMIFENRCQDEPAAMASFLGSCRGVVQLSGTYSGLRATTTELNAYCRCVARYFPPMDYVNKSCEFRSDVPAMFSDSRVRGNCDHP